MTAQKYAIPEAFNGGGCPIGETGTFLNPNCSCATSGHSRARRMLDAEGSRFSNQLNEARMQLATQYLANPRMRITDIAQMLGYASVGAFSRWHRQIFGEPPRKRRK